MNVSMLETAAANVRNLEQQIEGTRISLYINAGRVNSRLVDAGIISNLEPLLCGWSDPDTFEFPVNNGRWAFPVRLVISLSTSTLVTGVEGLCDGPVTAEIELEAKLVSEAKVCILGTASWGADDILEAWFEQLADSVALRIIAQRADRVVRFHGTYDIQTRDRGALGSGAALKKG